MKDYNSLLDIRIRTGIFTEEDVVQLVRKGFLEWADVGVRRLAVSKDMGVSTVSLLQSPKKAA